MEKARLQLLMAKTVVLMQIRASYEFSQCVYTNFHWSWSRGKGRPQGKPGLYVIVRRECTFTVLKKIRNKENVPLH